MKKILVSILVICTLLFSLLSLPEFSFLKIAFASPDSYGNQINWLSIEQWESGAYILKANWTSTGNSIRVVDGEVVRFKVGIQFNSTLASSTEEAISYTRVKMNITNGGSIWTNIELNNTSCVLSGSWYVIVENGVWNQTGKPQAGVTYECSAKYEGYY